MLKIKIENVINANVDKSDVAILRGCLSFSYEKYIINRFTRRPSRVMQQESCIKSNGKFLTGHIPRVKKFLKENNIEYIINDNSEKLSATNAPIIKGKILRADQLRLVNAILNNQRGIIISPTGSGKTLIAGAIISCYKNKKVLFLCHTKTLLKQAQSDFKEYGLKNITLVGEGEKNISGDIVVGTWQSFIKLNQSEMSDKFDIIIIDEVHHISSKKVSYAEILSNSLAPIRVGLTATFPASQETQMAIEGLIGEVIGEFTEEEATEQGIVAKTKVLIRKVAYSQTIRDLSRYADVYHNGVVSNKSYNKQIIEEAKIWVDKGHTILIMFIETEQGKLLKLIADDMNFPCELIYGATESDIRENARHNLQSKKIKCVLASVVWKEGVNIPSLSVVINAAGGKSEIALRQLKGRGSRVFKDKDGVIKDELLYIDFFNNSHPHLVNHFGHRFSTYCDLGWIQ